MKKSEEAEAGCESASPVLSLCPSCGAQFRCDATGEGCWCASLPHVFVPQSDSCWCPTCLKQQIERRAGS